MRQDIDQYIMHGFNDELEKIAMFGAIGKVVGKGARYGRQLLGKGVEGGGRALERGGQALQGVGRKIKRGRRIAPRAVGPADLNKNLSRYLRAGKKGLKRAKFLAQSLARPVGRGRGTGL